MGQNGIRERFRGSFIAKIDDRGRIKIPAKYLATLQDHYGKDVYLTSVNGDHILFYPLKVWVGIETRIEALTVRDPDVEEFISRISYWGSESEIDPKGRILIPSDLRVSSQLRDEVLILGKVDYMVIWNRDIFAKQFVAGTFSDEKLQKVARILNELSALSRNA